MAKRKEKILTLELPLLKTVEQMAQVSGIGENTLRRLLEEGKLEYIQNGNRKLIAVKAIWQWYEANKTSAPRYPGEVTLIGDIPARSAK